MEMRASKVAAMRQEQGFTLVELLIATVVLAVLAGISIPTISGILGRQELKGAARYIMGDFMSYRMSAVKGHHNVTFIFNQNITTVGATSASYTADATHYLVWADKNSDGQKNEGEVVLRSLGGGTESGKFPRVKITSATFGSGTFTYNSLGGPSNGLGGTITLADDSGSVRKVIVNSVGSVRVE